MRCKQNSARNDSVRPYRPKLVRPENPDAKDREAFVELADRTPGGRKNLGERLCRRVTCFASGKYAPTASEWAELVAYGAPREAVAQRYIAKAEDLLGIPLPEVKATVAAFITEYSQAAAAALVYESEPTPENLARVKDELYDIHPIGNGLTRLFHRISELKADMRTNAMDRLMPARSDRRMAR